MKKYKIILYSDDWQVDIAIALLNGNINRGGVQVIGCTSKELTMFKKWHGYEFMSCEEALKSEYDYIIACDFSYECPTKDKIAGFGFSKDKIIKGRILENPCFDIEKYDDLHKNPPSIISSTCFGGVTCHDLDLPFMSPFVNLAVKLEEFYKMLDNLKSNMDTPIQQKMITDKNIKFPVGILDNGFNHTEIHFNHYKSFDEAQTAWNRRKERINYENIFVTAILWNEESLESFLNIKYNKVGFAFFDLDKDYEDVLPCNIYFDPNVMKMSSNYYWMFLHDSSHDNKRRLFPRMFDPYKMLLKEKDWKLI